MIRRITLIVWIVAGSGLLLSQITEARNPIRRDFFDYYTSAQNTRLDAETLAALLDINRTHRDTDARNAAKAALLHKGSQI